MFPIHPCPQTQHVQLVATTDYEILGQNQNLNLTLLHID